MWMYELLSQIILFAQTPEEVSYHSYLDDKAHFIFYHSPYTLNMYKLQYLKAWLSLHWAS